MSDQSPGPGWWAASDGLWYPPEQHPDPEWRAQHSTDEPPLTATQSVAPPSAAPAEPTSPDPTGSQPSFESTPPESTPPVAAGSPASPPSTDPPSTASPYSVPPPVNAPHPLPVVPSASPETVAPIGPTPANPTPTPAPTPNPASRVAPTDEPPASVPPPSPAITTVPPGLETSAGPRSKRGTVVALVAGVVVLVVLIAAVVMVGRNRGSSNVDSGAAVTPGSAPAGAQEELRLEPASFAGDDPFTTAVTVKQVADFPGSVTAVVDKRAQAEQADAATGTRTASGSTPGLYGGTKNESLCDAAALVTFLEQNPDKAAAWAAVQGLTPSALPDFVKGLTPVALTSDTRVTNHGFKDGKAIPAQAVLQAGTAVLVDKTGVPRVKCSCGNPLLPPAPIKVTTAATKGTPWAGYKTDRVTTVVAGPEAADLTLVDLGTGNLYTQPTGGGGGGQIVLLSSGASGSPTKDAGPSPELGVGIGTPAQVNEKYIIGTPLDAAVAAVSKVLGPPASDKSESVQGECGIERPGAPQKTIRNVEWPGLEISGSGPPGAVTIIVVVVSGKSSAVVPGRIQTTEDPPWKTQNGLGIGSSTTELQAAYPQAKITQGRSSAEGSPGAGWMNVGGMEFHVTGMSGNNTGGKIDKIYITPYMDDC